MDAEEAARAIAPLKIERLIALGLLERDGRSVHSSCALALCNGLILAHDRVEHEEDVPRADHVLGVNPSAHTLACLTVRRNGGRALDVGAGSGIQALFAARHHREVVASDTNPRALNFLVFNALLNGIGNIECRLGSLFEPVAGSRFDLITCNPPYVISPETQLIFRDSGMPGHGICEQVVRQAPAHLEDGGYACILCNWTHRKDQDWSEPIRDWVQDSGCDTWLLRGTTETPLTYAAAWTRSQDGARYAAALDRWQVYYSQQGIEALSMGAVILRRRSDGRTGWFRHDSWPAKPVESCSTEIERVFAAEEYLRAKSDADLAEQTFALAANHSLLEKSRFTEGELVCEARKLELTQGLRFGCDVDNQTLYLLSQCDGRHTLAQAAEELSRSSGVPEAQVRQLAATAVRQLLAYGFLVPESAGHGFPWFPPGGGNTR